MTVKNASHLAHHITVALSIDITDLSAALVITLHGEVLCHAASVGGRRVACSGRCGARGRQVVACWC